MRLQREIFDTTLPLLLGALLVGGARADLRDEVFLGHAGVERVCEMALGAPRIRTLLGEADGDPEARARIATELEPVMRGQVQPRGRARFEEPERPTPRNLMDRTLELERRGLIGAVTHGFRLYDAEDREKLRFLRETLGPDRFQAIFSQAATDVQYELTRLWTIRAHAALVSGSLPEDRPAIDWSLAEAALRNTAARVRTELAALLASRRVDVPPVLEDVLRRPGLYPGPLPEGTPLPPMPPPPRPPSAVAEDSAPAGSASGVLGQSS